MTVSIKLEPVSRTLFSEQAQHAAEECSFSVIRGERKLNTKHNKASQVRRFYDELVMWHDKVAAIKDKEERERKFHEFEPFIQMMSAKVAYARGRDLVNDTFELLFRGIVQQIDSPEKLKTAKLFMESFMGFKKWFEGQKI